MFAMSGDGSTGDIQIPAVFLFYNEGDILKKAMEIIMRNTQGHLRIRLADKATTQGSVCWKPSWSYGGGSRLMLTVCLAVYFYVHICGILNRLQLINT